MPIPYTDVEDFGGLGSAAYLKFERSPDDACSLGALLVISARGEPLEFGYNRVRIPHPFLWREDDLRRYVQRRLTASLLSVCSQQPRLLLCLGHEVSPWLFSQDLQVEVRVVRVAPSVSLQRRVDIETGEVIEEVGEPPHIAWQPAPPDVDSIERRLFEHLTTHGLLLEPFERVVTGLREVYGPAACLSQR
jgi:hypothetical protein